MEVSVLRAAGIAILWLVVCVSDINYHCEVQGLFHMTVIKINEELCIWVCICCAEQVPSTSVRLPSKVQKSSIQREWQAIAFCRNIASNADWKQKRAGGVFVWGPGACLCGIPSTGKESCIQSGSTTTRLHVTFLFWKMVCRMGS